MRAKSKTRVERDSKRERERERDGDRGRYSEKLEELELVKDHQSGSHTH